MEALYDDPGLLIHVRGVTFTPYLMSESRMQDGWLVMERCCQWGRVNRSEEHTSELQSLMRISYAVFCLKKNKNAANDNKNKYHITYTRSEQHTSHLHRPICTSN